MVQAVEEASLRPYMKSLVSLLAGAFERSTGVTIMEPPFAGHNRLAESALGTQLCPDLSQPQLRPITRVRHGGIEQRLARGRNPRRGKGLEVLLP